MEYVRYIIIIIIFFMLAQLPYGSMQQLLSRLLYKGKLCSPAGSATSARGRRGSQGFAELRKAPQGSAMLRWASQSSVELRNVPRSFATLRRASSSSAEASRSSALLLFRGHAGYQMKTPSFNSCVALSACISWVASEH